MEPSLVIWGIKATLRAAQAGANLYGEHARDRKICLPDLELPQGSRSDQVSIFLDENRDIIGQYPALAACWDDVNKTLAAVERDKIDAAYAVILQYLAKQKLLGSGNAPHEAQRDAEIFAYGTMIEQWREDRKPPSAFARFALTFTDIGLEYVAANPSIFGASSRGEKFITAFAGKLAELIPDDTDAFGPKVNFADRVFGIFLRAGLSTLADNTAVVFRYEKVAALVAGVTMPIVDALPEDLAEQIIYRELVDTFAGPSASVAFKLLAENTEGYLGRNFASDKALGAVTKALFEEIQNTSEEHGIVKVFSNDGIVSLYQATLGVAVERPSLFIGIDDNAKNELLKDLLNGTASVLRTYPRFEGPIGASLASMVVTSVGDNAAASLKLEAEQPWENVAIRALELVTGSLSGALDDVEDDGSIKGALRAFSDGQLIELARIVLDQAAMTPGMLGSDNIEVQSILSGMAVAMAADDNLLLSSEEWLDIAAIAAERAAANPGRLFGLDSADPNDALAVTLMKSILEVAGNAWEGRRTDQTLLFGESLQMAILAVLDGLAGNIEGVAGNPVVVQEFLSMLEQQAKANADKFGNKGFIKVFVALIDGVLADGSLPNEAAINEALSA